MADNLDDKIDKSNCPNRRPIAPKEYNPDNLNFCGAELVGYCRHQYIKSSPCGCGSQIYCGYGKDIKRDMTNTHEAYKRFEGQGHPLISDNPELN